MPLLGRYNFYCLKQQLESRDYITALFDIQKSRYILDTLATSVRPPKLNLFGKFF
jgi:hypothetical protein